MNFLQGWKLSSDHHQGEDREQLQGQRRDEEGKDFRGVVWPQDLRHHRQGGSSLLNTRNTKGSQTMKGDQNKGSNFLNWGGMYGL